MENESTKRIALTFDDGPNTTVTPLVLDLLAKYGGAGTFFLIGENITPESEAVSRRAFEMGCELANHSFTHADMTELSAEQIQSEIARTEERILRITGKPTVFFRPPYIAVNETMYANIDRCFIQGHGCRDWEPEVSAAQRAETVLGAARDGAIILLHDQPDNYQTLEALRTILPALARQGYRFVTVSELFAAKGLDPSAPECRGRLFSDAQLT